MPRPLPLFVRDEIPRGKKGRRWPARSRDSLKLETLEQRLALSASWGESSGYDETLPVWFERLEDVSLPPSAQSRALASASGETAEKANTSEPLEETHDWIVRFTAEALQGISSVAQTQSLLGDNYTAEVVEGLGLVGQVLVRTAGADPKEIDQWLASNTHIASYSPDTIVQLQVEPNDAQFDQLWGLNNTGQSGGTPDADIDAPEAWEITTGSRETIVAVIDTGIDTDHPELVNNLWVNPGEIPNNGLDDDQNGFVDDIHGWNFRDNSPNVNDTGGHGTHVSGTIAAEGNNASEVSSDADVVGVNWQASIMALKAFGTFGASTSDLIAATNYATMMAGTGQNVRVINASYGGGFFSSQEAASIEAAGDAGILFVAAAGNDSSNTDSFAHYPSNYDVETLLSVAATTRSDTLADFSNYGAVTVDLGAPGDSVLSTVPGGGLDTYRGTSMATPHVAGTAALIWSVNPEATPGEVRDLILAGVDPLPALDGITVTGGRLNAHNSLLLATGGADDHGDDAASATQASPGQTRFGILSSGDVDWFAFTAQEGEDYRFQTELNSLENSVLTLYDSDGQTVLVSDDDSGEGLASLIDWTATASGTFYLEVRAFSVLQTGSYRLSLLGDDHSDQAAGATVVSINSDTAGNIEREADTDWFALDVISGKEYRFETQLGSLSESVLTLYGEDGQTPLESAPSGSGGGSSISWSANFTATVYLEVAAGTSSQTGTYTLSIASDDHSNSASGATPVSVPSTASGNLELVGDVDWFAFEAEADQAYTFGTTLLGLSDSVLRLYDTDGATLLEVDDDGGSGLASRITWTAPQDGTFYLEVSGYSSSQTGTYELWLDLFLPSVDDHGNDYQTATAVSVPGTVAGGIEVGNDEDYFSFQATAGELYVFETTLLGLSDSTLTLYDQDGTTQLAFNDDGGFGLASRIQWRATDSGTFYLRVAAFASSQTGTYLLSLSREPLPVDDHGNTAETATSVGLNQSVQGDLENYSDIDWFRFHASQGADYVFETELGTLFDSVLWLYDSDGATLLATDDNSGVGLGSQIEWTAPHSGDFYLAVLGYLPSDLGTYTLNLTGPPTINFQDYLIGSYGGNNDATGAVTIEDAGATLHLQGNRWKQIEYPYVVTSDTVLSFDFRSPSEGEIHGIGLDTDTTHQQNRTFQLFGTQDWGQFGDYDYADSAPGWTHYTIPLGLYYTGSFNHLFFINDDDANTNAESFFANVALSNISVNNPPIANNDSLTVQEDSSAIFVDVLNNDTSDPDVGETLTVIGVTQGTGGGSVTIPDGTGVSYTPAADFSGTETFSYTISDGNGGTDVATVTVTVNGTQDPPTANNDSLIVQEDSSGTFVDVLANDTALPDLGETLTIANVTQGTSGGTVSIVGGTGLSYTPAADFFGTESFSYTISDGNGGTDVATVTVIVNGTQDPPTANNDSLIVQEDSGAGFINVLGNDTALPDLGEIVTVIAVTQGTAGGTVSIASGVGVNYTPLADFFGVETFSYTISDGNGGTDVATVTVTVNNIQDPPVALPDNASTLQDTDVIIEVLQNDFDPDGDPLTIAEVSPASNGTVSIAPDRTTVTYSPDDGFTGNDTFTYIVRDNSANLVTATVSVTVEPPNTLPTINFNDYPLVSYGGSNDDSGPVQIEDGGATLHLSGNRWKAIAFPYEVTPNTVIEFDFRSTQEGEIHGIGLDTNLKHQPNRTFQFYGTQDWGISGAADYSDVAPGTKHFVIPVGQSYTGSMNYLFFVNDDDAASAAESFFSNVVVHEGTSPSTAPSLAGFPGDLQSPNRLAADSLSSHQPSLIDLVSLAPTSPASSLPDWFAPWQDRSLPASPVDFAAERELQTILALRLSLKDLGTEAGLSELQDELDQFFANYR